MKTHQLRALVAVADYGSIQRAAQALHVSQPAVTKALRDLEREIGVTVIARTPKGHMSIRTARACSGMRARSNSNFVTREKRSMH